MTFLAQWERKMAALQEGVLCGIVYTYVVDSGRWFSVGIRFNGPWVCQGDNDNYRQRRR